MNKYVIYNICNMQQQDVQYSSTVYDTDDYLM